MDIKTKRIFGTLGVIGVGSGCAVAGMYMGTWGIIVGGFFGYALALATIHVASIEKR